MTHSELVDGSIVIADLSISLLRNMLGQFVSDGSVSEETWQEVVNLLNIVDQ